MWGAISCGAFEGIGIVGAILGTEFAMGGSVPIGILFMADATAYCTAAALDVVGPVL